MYFTRLEPVLVRCAKSASHPPTCRSKPATPYAWRQWLLTYQTYESVEAATAAAWRTTRAMARTSCPLCVFPSTCAGQSTANMSKRGERLDTRKCYVIVRGYRANCVRDDARGFGSSRGLGGGGTCSVRVDLLQLLGFESSSCAVARLSSVRWSSIHPPLRCVAGDGGESGAMAEASSELPQRNASRGRTRRLDWELWRASRWSGA